MGLKGFVFDGINSLDNNLYVAQRTIWNAPERKVSMIDIPARNGQVTIDYGNFSNIQITYSAKNNFDNEYAFKENIRNIRNKLCSKTGYKKLTDNYNPEEYRMAVYKSAFVVNSQFNNTASQFNITFDCKPQRFLVVGDMPVSVSNGSTIINPTEFPSKPLIELKGKGTLGIGDWILTITGTTTQVLYIDCDIMEVYKITGGVREGANSLVSMNRNDFPELVSGSNGISIGSGVSNVKITPRWWRI